MEQIPGPSHEVFSSKAPVGQKMAASARGTASACSLRQDSFSLEYQYIFAEEGRRFHTVRLQKCAFFAHLFCCETAVPGLVEPKELSQPEGAPHTHTACARCCWKALGQRDFVEGEEVPSATCAYGGYCSSGQKDPALPKTTLCFGVHSFQANNTSCCSPQTSKFSLHATFEMQYVTSGIIRGC